MTVQDDAREAEMIELFRLNRPGVVTRSGTDAILQLDGSDIPFELKSTTTQSVTTVRDFGPAHIEKWIGKHWLIGFYSPDGSTLLHSVYGSPDQMAPWIEEKAAYIQADFDLADLVGELLTPDVMHQIFEEKETYTLNDARKLQKMQYTVAEYKELMDLDDGYSPSRMLEILRVRCKYLIERGATLNNPHIPGSYFTGWERITTRHGHRLRELVRSATNPE